MFNLYQQYPVHGNTCAEVRTKYGMSIITPNFN